MGLFAAAGGYDGMLRWAGFNWQRDPLFDSAFGGLPAGDTFLIYPGARASTRWERLRDGIEDFEKIRLLRSIGAMTPELENALAEIDPKAEISSDGEETCRRVDAVVAALNAAGSSVETDLAEKRKEKKKCKQRERHCWRF